MRVCQRVMKTSILDVDKYNLFAALTHLWRAPSLLRPQTSSADAAELECHLRFSQQLYCHPLLCRKQGSSRLRMSSSERQGLCGLVGPPDVWFLPVDKPDDRARWIKMTTWSWQALAFGDVELNIYLHHHIGTNANTRCNILIDPLCTVRF